MRSRMIAASVTVLLTLFAAGITLGWIQNDPKKTWEYKHLDLSSSADQPQYGRILNELGAGGWELVAVDREQTGGRVHFFLKRAK